MNKIYFKKWWSFLRVITKNEIKVRYKNAIFGFLWMFINPVIQMLIIGLVFQFFVPVKVDNYFLFLLLGLLLWNFFAYTVQKSVQSIVNERLLISKSNFPRETIVLSIVLSNFINLLISIFLVFLFICIVGKISILNWLVSFLIFIPLLMITTGFSLMLASLNVKFRDINFMVQAIIPLWFYTTPIVYSLELIPVNLRNYFYLNPLTGIVELYRFLVMGVIPNSFGLAYFSLSFSLIIFVLGLTIFLKQSPYFDDWV